MAGTARDAAPRRLVVCADDYALAAAVDEGILALVAAGRVSAVSCMVDSPRWPAAAPALMALADRTDLGLHLNLTQDYGAGAFASLPALILRAYARGLPGRRLEALIAAQLAAFADAVGRAPDYVDGHQHVHQLPMIRERVLAAWDRQFGGQRCWWRDTRPPASLPGFKARVIALLGAAPAVAMARAHGHAVNNGLLGVYDFHADASQYTALLAQWLQQAPDGSLLMCHPARGGEATDVIAGARQVEYEVLASAAFAQLLAAEHIVVAKGRDLYPVPR